jgi:hypothetical protein
MLARFEYRERNRLAYTAQLIAVVGVRGSLDDAVREWLNHPYQITA